MSPSDRPVATATGRYGGEPLGDPSARVFEVFLIIDEMGSRGGNVSGEPVRASNQSVHRFQVPSLCQGRAPARAAFCGVVETNQTRLDFPLSGGNRERQ